MSPWRSSRAARPPATSPQGPRTRATHSTVWLPALLLTLGGCSSAGDSYLGDAPSTSTADSSLSGQDPSDSASVGADESTGAQDGGTDPSGADDGGGASTGGETGAPPEVPQGEPTPEDLVEAKAVEADACDLATPVSLTLRTLDAAATVSPALARDAALSEWVSLTGIRIRPWEFFNYYGFGYPAAEPGLVTVTPNLAPGTGPDEFTLQIGVATQALANEQRPPLHLTLALDNSNSMEGKAEDMLRATGAAIAASLRAGDTLSIVTWNAKSAPVLELHAISGADDPVVLDKLDKLELGGSAELYAGLTAAYKLAEAAYDPNHWNRVVLVSDGGATANDTDLAVISEHVEHSPLDMKLGFTPGIYLAGVGVGDAGAYRSDLMDACARAGRGASLFIGTEAEADKRFGKQLATTLGAAVRAVEVHLELPPGFEVVHDLADDATNDVEPGPDGLHLGPNASLVLHRKLRHCAKADAEAKLLVRVGFVDEATGEQREVKSAVKLATLLAETSPALAKGVAVQSYAEALQRWQTAPADLAPALDAALAALKSAQDLAPNDPELAEIAAVLAVLVQG